MQFTKTLAKRKPGLSLKLSQAGIDETPQKYVEKTLKTAGYIAAGLTISLAFLIPLVFIVPAFIGIFFITYNYFLRRADLAIQHKKKDIKKEIVFAGRFLIIELESGVPIVKAFENLEENYDAIGDYFGLILNKISLGTTLEKAIDETILICPSQPLSKILWQISNSIKTGSDAVPALNTVLGQVVREHKIEVEEYGKKLNPIAMFYLMVSIIMPSLGVTMIVVLATFIGFQISFWILLLIAFFVGFIQFMFLSIIKVQRPPINT